MSTTTLLKTFTVTLVTFLLLDALWLTFVAIEMFKREAGAIMRPDPNLLAIVPFYLIYAAALTALAVHPSIGKGASGAAWRGGLLGLAAYATYDLTNLATLKGWTPALALKDIAWGTFASAAAALAGRAASTPADEAE